MAPDVDLDVVARGTPGMSGADLANLVNEAALHAVRRGSHDIAMEDFETARDRVLMGQRRDSMVLSDAEKERVAYHEGGHAAARLRARRTPTRCTRSRSSRRAWRSASPSSCPMEERHIYPREYIEDALCVRMGGRVAELLVYGDLSTGAANDLVGNTELARKMVREWGMSDAIGPMAWGSQGQVFLGEDLMHTRDYSDDTSKVIDDEVERILREQEQRAIDVLSKHRRGLDAVARALLEHETIDGARSAAWSTRPTARPVHADGAKSVPHFNGALINGRANGLATAPLRSRRPRQSRRRRRARERRPHNRVWPTPRRRAPARPRPLRRPRTGWPSENWPPPPWPPADPAGRAPLAPPPEDPAPR